ncbi:4-alpha-glucanotransferase [Actinomadura parmotrematis]|uniref:4-alpha-glucanotransferase n=1 Tax=Actinomadura parmotrematis TaxID=2864039 RepID=A0ABS7FX59_9ACTN|nr:4-alpha-glucanotransferase [Actinomadura parmotrematis]MBW8484182.1 4-alpha-glucanotransferase [Actinomadura parmotrematis]
MTDDDLIELARAHRVATNYIDWQGEETDVSPDTLRAVLTGLGLDVASAAAVREERRLLALREARLLPPVIALREGEDGGLREGTIELAGGGTAPSGEAARLPLGWHRLRAGDEEAALLVAPRALPPAPRAWGFTVQLYSLRSRGSWGLGDLRDLADLASWSGREHGAGFVLINPLHAAEPSPPITPSPYSPLSKRFPSPQYLRVEDVPEFAAADPAERGRVAEIGRLVRDASRTPDPLDRDAAWHAKKAALEALHALPRADHRRAAYEDFKAARGEPLALFATWSALAEAHGADWRSWPAELHDAHGPAVAAAVAPLADRVEFHIWLQFLLDEQLGAAQAAAREAGMPIGIVHDLAVGVRTGSADEWTHRDLFARGISVGAPPDEFNQRGQDWGQPPWHPQRLADAGYGPYRDMIAGALRHGGGLRLDHAMQLSRLWWVPEGGSPADGTYVGYDSDVLLAVLTAEAHAAGAVIVGEDLGTVEPHFRDGLSASGVLGTSLLWFERDGDGAPRPPEDWREPSLATVGTHDMPPITGVLHADHIALRDRLGLLTRPLAVELDEARRQLAAWLGLLHERGLLATPPEDVLAAVREGSDRHDAEVVAALHGLLAATPARLLGVALADAVGERRTQNQPGTVDEYPNWRVPLAGPGGTPLLLDDLPGDQRVADVVSAVARPRSAS